MKENNHQLKQRSQQQQLLICYGQLNRAKKNLQLQLLELIYTTVSTHLREKKNRTLTLWMRTETNDKDQKHTRTYKQ